MSLFKKALSAALDYVIIEEDPYRKITNGNFCKNMIEADENAEEAARLKSNASEKYAKAKQKVDTQWSITETALCRLNGKKKDILNTSINEFLHVYKQIMNIDFRQGDGIKELEFNALALPKIEKLRLETSDRIENMTDLQVVVEWITKGISGSILEDSKHNLRNAEIMYDKANVAAEHAETICITLDAATQGANRMIDLLQKFNLLLNNSIPFTKKLIEAKGYDRYNYSDKDIESIRTCMNTVKAVKDILDVQIIDKECKITQQAVAALQTGERYLSQINIMR